MRAESPYPDYTMEATSEEEGIQLDLSLLPMPSSEGSEYEYKYTTNNNDNDDDGRNGGGDYYKDGTQSPFDEEAADGGNFNNANADAVYSSDLFADEDEHDDEQMMYDEYDQSESDPYDINRLMRKSSALASKKKVDMQQQQQQQQQQQRGKSARKNGAAINMNHKRGNNNTNTVTPKKGNARQRSKSRDATHSKQKGVPSRSSATPQPKSEASNASSSMKLRVVSAQKKKKATAVPTSTSTTPNTETSHHPSLYNTKDTDTGGVGYYTKQPKKQSFFSGYTSFSFAQRLREYRHSNCIMTPITSIVLLAILTSSLVTMVLTIPQVVLGILLGPLVKRNFWLVEFLYKWNVARWGHVKIMRMANKDKKNKAAAAGGGGGGDKRNASKKGNGNKTNTGTAAAAAAAVNTSKLGGHSSTLHQRITVVPHRVYIHPIPQFIDNLSYLIVTTPPPNATHLPLIGILIDCSESQTILNYLEQIYEKYYIQLYPRNEYRNKIHHNRIIGIEVYGILCTHCHHDHTAGVGDLRKDLCQMRLGLGGGNGSVSVGAGGATTAAGGGGGGGGNNNKGDDVTVTSGGGRYHPTKSDNNHDGNNDGKKKQKEHVDVYESAPGNVLVVGGAVEHVPHCNLFVKNGCFIPLPCLSTAKEDNGDNGTVQSSSNGGVNDMNEVVSIEVIGVPSHTRGSVVYALRNRAAPGSVYSVGDDDDATAATAVGPLQSHLFTGDAIFTGGGGVPFEADLEFTRDNFIKNPKNLKNKNGSSKFRPGAGLLSMERCFAEVLTRASGPWSLEEELANNDNLPQDGGSITTTSQFDRLLESSPSDASSLTTAHPQTLLYPGHEYTTDLLMRQFDQKTIPSDGHWTRMSPSVFFETASHYLVSAHRRALPPGQKLLTLPTPLERECVVNPNFRSLNRRGECLINALNLWYEFGAVNLIPEKNDVEDERLTVSHRLAITRSDGDGDDDASKKKTGGSQSVFTTVYSSDLNKIIKELRSGMIDSISAADKIEALHSRLDEKVIGRRPIPNTLPSHKNVYLGVVALCVLGSAPSAVTVSDANIMNMAPPVDSTDNILVSKRRLIAALDGLGLLAKATSPRVEDIIHLLWKEARLDYDGSNFDIEADIDNGHDLIELGVLKLALFGVAFNQTSKLCLPCNGNSKPKYDENSWVITSKIRRTNGELVRHDADSCLLCRDTSATCLHRRGS